MNRTGRVFATLLLALSATGVAAQYPGGSGRPGGAGTGPGGKSGLPPLRAQPQEAAPVTLTDQVQAQLGEIEEDLRINSAQRKLWTVFADRVLKLAGDVTRDRDRLRFPKGTAAEQFDFVTDRARDRLTAVEDIGDAAKQLYATLSPTQKDIADLRLARIAVPLVANVQNAAGRPDGGGSMRTNPNPP